MKVTCIRACTVPKRGLVEKGQTIDVADFDLVKFPFLKHFAAPAKAVAAEVEKKPLKGKKEDPLS